MQENAGKRQAATLEDKSKGLQEGLVEAAARDSEHFRGWNGFKGFKKAYSRAWWKVPPGIRSILMFF